MNIFVRVIDPIGLIGASLDDILITVVGRGLPGSTCFLVSETRTRVGPGPDEWLLCIHQRRVCSGPLQFGSGLMKLGSL